jgi:predicted GIY-YIG superfamily endonuclease
MSYSVYLLHFSVPYQHARHYLGITKGKTVFKRLRAHRMGQGANLTKVVTRAGVELILAAVWADVPRSEERRLKNRGGLSRICPICRTIKEMEHDPHYSAI